MSDLLNFSKKHSVVFGASEGRQAAKKAGRVAAPRLFLAAPHARAGLAIRWSRLRDHIDRAVRLLGEGPFEGTMVRLHGAQPDAIGARHQGASREVIRERAVIAAITIGKMPDNIGVFDRSKRYFLKNLKQFLAPRGILKAISPAGQGEAALFRPDRQVLMAGRPFINAGARLSPGSCS